jgi:hypothetical protein
VVEITGDVGGTAERADKGAGRDVVVDRDLVIVIRGRRGPTTHDEACWAQWVRGECVGGGG